MFVCELMPITFSLHTSIAWKERIIMFFKLIGWKKPVSGKWDKKEITTDIKVLVVVAIILYIILLAEVTC